MYHDAVGCKKTSCDCKTTGRLLRGETSTPWYGWYGRPKIRNFLIMYAVVMSVLFLSNFLSSEPEEKAPTGDELFWAGKHEQALPYYYKVLEKDPNNLYALSKKCDILRFLNSYQEAITCYDGALAIHPNSFVLQGGKKETNKLLSQQ